MVGTLKTLAVLARPMTLFDDHRRLVAMQVGKLVGLMVDQYKDAVFGAKQGLEAGLGHGNSFGCG
jgi:hypothetical protein